MSAPTTEFSNGTGTISTTAEGNGLLLPINPKLTTVRVRFGFKGTFTSVVVAVRGRLKGLAGYYPVRAINPNGNTPIADSTSISLTDSTNQSIEVDGSGFDYLEVWVVSGTPTALTVEAYLYPASSPLLNVTNLTVTGTTSLTAATTIGVASATAFVVGPNGTTNPTLKVVTNTASAATGLSITSAAAAGGLALTVLSSGNDENLTINAKGSGTVTINGTATGQVTIGANLGITDAKNVVLGTSTGSKIGTATTQLLGFWNATPVVQPVANTDTTTAAAGGTSTVYLNTTFTGPSGSAAYTIGGVIKALKAVGILAA